MEEGVAFFAVGVETLIGVWSTGYVDLPNTKYQSPPPINPVIITTTITIIIIFDQESPFEVDTTWGVGVEG